MQQSNFFDRFSDAQPVDIQIGSPSRKLVIGIILAVALVSFEIFNFDTTRYALDSILGSKEFLSVTWATILAIAFCAIDFAGLARIFTPERGADEPRAVWFLMGAWLLGATMNAVTTWWAVSLTLLSHDFSNEVLGRETLLKLVPVFVAALVLLTRILFIGAFSVAGEHLFSQAGDSQTERRPQPDRRVRAELPLPQNAPIREPRRTFVEDEPLPVTSQRGPTGRTHPRPAMPGNTHRMPAPMSASAKPHR